MTTWFEISSVVDGMVMVEEIDEEVDEEIDEEVEEVAEMDEGQLPRPKGRGLLGQRVEK